MSELLQNDEAWLHLFTSNLRELYISDAIDLLAAPEGLHYRFRYEAKYLSESARAKWQVSEALAGYPVAVHFSLQHPADFHPAAFIPLRCGTVVRTAVEGGTCIAYFRLGGYLPLADRPENVASERARRVRQYSAELRTLLPGATPDDAVHATIGKSPASLVEPTGNAGRDFETQVRYLTPSVPMYRRTYFRVASIVTAEGGDVRVGENGVISFIAGTEYVLNIAYYLHEPLAESARIELVSPDSLTVVGDNELVVRSRYDVIPVRLFPPFRENLVSIELAIKTVQPTLGPVVRLPIVIRPGASVALFGPTLGFGAASAIAIPPILASGQNLAWRIAFAVVGAAAVGLGLWWRRSRGLGA